MVFYPVVDVGIPFILLQYAQGLVKPASSWCLRLDSWAIQNAPCLALALLEELQKVPRRRGFAWHCVISALASEFVVITNVVSWKPEYLGTRRLLQLRQPRHFSARCARLTSAERGRCKRVVQRNSWLSGLTGSLQRFRRNFLVLLIWSSCVVWAQESDGGRVEFVG